MIYKSYKELSIKHFTLLRDIRMIKFSEIRSKHLNARQQKFWFEKENWVSCLHAD